MTTDNDVITVNYCVNYGGRAEIAEAARQIARDAAAGGSTPERVDERTISEHLHRPDIPDVDLFIRTSGEQRASNFILWQAAYAEYVFQDKLWRTTTAATCGRPARRRRQPQTADSGARSRGSCPRGWPISRRRNAGRCRSRRSADGAPRRDRRIAAHRVDRRRHRNDFADTGFGVGTCRSTPICASVSRRRPRPPCWAR